MAPTLIAAQHQTPNDSRPTGRPRGEGVNEVKFFSRRHERRESFDQLSQVERALALDALRERREEAVRNKDEMLPSSRYR